MKFTKKLKMYLNNGRRDSKGDTRMRVIRIILYRIRAIARTF